MLSEAKTIPKDWQGTETLRVWRCTSDQGCDRVGWREVVYPGLAGLRPPPSGPRWTSPGAEARFPDMSRQVEASMVRATRVRNLSNMLQQAPRCLRWGIGQSLGCWVEATVVRQRFGLRRGVVPLSHAVPAHNELTKWHITAMMLSPSCSTA